MTLESVIKFDLDDSAFQRFTAQFNKYQKELGKTTGMWKQAGTFQDIFGKNLGKVTSITTANVRLQKMLEDSMRKQVVSTRQSEMLWSSIGRSSGVFAKNIASATRSFLSLGGIAGGLLGLGGLWGLNRMAGSVANQRRSSQGLGVSIGQQKAFDINFGRLVDPSYLDWINSMEGDITKQTAAYALTGRGLSGNTSTDAVAMLDAIRAKAKSTDLNMLMPILNAYGVNMSMDELRRLRNSSDVGQIKDQYSKDSAGLNINDSVAKGWQDFVAQMERAGSSIFKTFVIGLAQLEKPLEDLSRGFTKFVETIMKSQIVNEAIEKLAHWLETFSGEISSPKFLDSVKSFTSDVGDLAQAIHGLLHPGETIGNAIDSAKTGFNDFRSGNAAKSFMIDQAGRANIFKMAASMNSKYGLPSGLEQTEAWLESGFNVNAPDSKAGAKGVMQLHGIMAKGINPYEPMQAMDRAGTFNQHLVQKYGQDIQKILAAYNAGETVVDAAIASAKRAHHQSDWMHYLPSDETRNYVSRGQVAITIINSTGGNATLAISQLGPL